MSIEAFNWAFKQPVPNSAAKFVLVAMANRAQPDNKGRVVAYTGIAYLAEVTSQDRKTVITNIAKLREWNLIEDTGDRVGRTKQVPVYELKCPPDLFTEQTQKRNGSKNGTVPKKAGNSPVFPGKQSQKRDTDSALDSPPIQKADVEKRGSHSRSAGLYEPAQAVIAKSRAKRPSTPQHAAAAVAVIAKEFGSKPREATKPPGQGALQ